MRLGIIGATGLVGREVLAVLEKFNIPLSQLNLYASEKSAGIKINHDNKELTVRLLNEGALAENDVFISSAGSSIAKKWGKLIRDRGLLLIDNSSVWRMEKNVPLIVPEINAEQIKEHHHIIANPNCSTIQMVLALNPLRKRYGIRRIVVSTYQAVTGSGQDAVTQLSDELADKININRVFPHPIAYNCLPQIDSFSENGYTREEIKMVSETQKIFAEPIPVTATCVRVPTLGGHAESINVELESAFDLVEIQELLSTAPGVEVLDNPSESVYPMPLYARGKDTVYVGRIRRDPTLDNALNIWVVTDNLRKGAATNTVQILKEWMEVC